MIVAKLFKELKIVEAVPLAELFHTLVRKPLGTAS